VQLNFSRCRSTNDQSRDPDRQVARGGESSRALIATAIYRCPCCGGRIVVIEIVERDRTPHTSRQPMASVIGIYSS
jgi:hypothetical protein